MRTSRILLFPALLCAVLCSGCQRPPAIDSLPALPLIEVSTFDDIVREQIDKARQAVEASPTDAEANGNLALTLAAYNLTDAAAVAYERTRLLAPGEGRWAYAHGHLLGWSGNPAGAIAILEPAFARHNGNFWLGYELANQYIAAGRLEESVALSQRLADDNDDRFQAFYGLGRALLRNGDSAAAVPALSRAVDMQGDIGELHFALATALRQTGDTAAAARHFEQATLHDDNVVDEHSPLMQTLARLDRSVKPTMNRAKVLFEQRRYAEAIELLEAVLERSPKRRDAYVHLVSLYGMTGQPELALQRYHDAVTQQVGDAALHLNMGILARKHGRLDEARRALEAAIAADSSLADAQAELGLVLEQLGQPDDAAARFRTAVELEPAHANANFMLGRYYAGVDDDASAIRHLQAAAASDSPATPLYLKTLAGVYLRVDRAADAVDALTLARTRLARSGLPGERSDGLRQGIERDLEAARSAAGSGGGSASETQVGAHR